MVLTVAGPLNWMLVGRPFCTLAAHTASRIAKKTERLSRSGGSPIAWIQTN